MFFVPEGIDLRNSDGESLNVFPDWTCTVPLNHMARLISHDPLGDEFLASWEL
jgi:hypothetical protein